MKAMLIAIHMAAILLLGVTGPALAQDPVQVTANNYVRAETDFR
jgi:uncharacterized membrane protein YciS (DUF1049 family)